MTKKSLILSLLIIGSALCKAQEKQAFPTMELAAALEKSEQQNKPVFYFVHASWCPHCHAMRDGVFKDAEATDFIKDKFVAAAIDGETEGGKTIMKKYGQSSYPAFLILNAKGELLYGFGGELKKPDLLRELNIALTPSRQLPTLHAAFDADKTNGEKCLEYVQTIRKARQDASGAAFMYFENVPDEKLISKTNWMIIANAIHDVDSREIQYVLKHQKEFAAVSSERRVSRKLVNLAQETLRPAMDRRDSISYKKDRLKAKRIGTHAADSLIFTYDMRFWENMGGWKHYAKTMDEAEKFIWENPEKLKEAGNVLAKNASDAKSIETGLILAERSLQLKEAYDGYLLVAKLHEKKRDKKKAAEFARKAKDFAAKLNFGTKEADEILARNS